MFDNGPLDWDYLAGDRVHSSYSSNSHEEGDRFHIWRETYERGQLQLIITERSGRYDVGLTSSCYADGENGVRIGEISTVSFDQYSHLGEGTAVVMILRDLDKKFGSSFEDIIDRAREFWWTWWCTW